MRLITAGAILWASLFTAQAGEADVVAAKAEKRSDGSFSFSVTVKHADTGWDHYANKFEIVTPNGTVLGTRVLTHPHVEEQPFTRSLGSVQIPDGLTEVIIRAGDSVHDLGGKELRVKLN